MKRTILLVWIALAAAPCGWGQTKLTILHTNDVHSQVEPVPSDSGGIVRAATYINRVRATEAHVLLLSAGDFFQGTPYFNLFFGKIEIELMNAMRYDAACLGNHEFDYGLDTLAQRLREARFPVVAANYDVSRTPLRDRVEPYTIIERGGIKIGVLGIGVELSTCSFGHLWRGMTISDPVAAANTVAKYLKDKEHCRLVICLSHIGHEDDFRLAESSRDIDIIIGAHTHRRLQEWRKNQDDKEIPIVQAGKSGLFVGRIDVVF
ncbi:MAG: metallophosphoesterase [Prevotellaceae bacterium]|jgi:5'-nucleotidase|nr:metallophosphoesterase [Prevotellaceae bacterium]